MNAELGTAVGDQLEVLVTLVKRMKRSTGVMKQGGDMHCPQCQHQNSDAAKFCEECGARLITACPQCGHQVSPTAKFCAECGTALTLGQKAKG